MSNSDENKLIQQRYVIEKRLGGGDMAMTYAALDQHSQEGVILKALHPGYIADWKIFELFEREVQALSHIKHPRIPRVIDYFKTENHDLFLVTSRVEGQSLEAKMESGWHPKEDEIKGIMLQVLEILIYLHQFNPPYVHRDIKPSNLMLDPDQQVHLIDFGAVQATLKPEGGSTIVGTFGFMSPEQFLGKPVPASDLYSLGVTAIQLLYGRDITFLVDDNLRLNFRPHLMVSAHFADWLDKMTHPNLEGRFASAEEARDALENHPVVLHAPALGKTVITRNKDQLLIESRTTSKSALAGLVGMGVVLFQGGVLNAFLMSFAEQGGRDLVIGLLFLSPFYLLLLAILFWGLRLFHARLNLEISPRAYTIKTTICGIFSWTQSGKTADILGCRYEETPFFNQQQDRSAVHGRWFPQIAIQDGVHITRRLGLGHAPSELKAMHHALEEYIRPIKNRDDTI